MTLLYMWFVLSRLDATLAQVEPEWWIALKYPGDYTYDYADSNQPSLRFAPDTLDASTSPLDKYVSNFFQAKTAPNHGWIQWNDADSQRKIEQNCKVAHAKGMLLFFHQNGGALLTHSIPNFPNPGSTYTRFQPRTPGGRPLGKDKGQDFMYIELDVNAVNKLTREAFVHMWPEVVERNHNWVDIGDMETRYPILAQLVRGSNGPWSPVGSIRHVQLQLRTTIITIVVKPCAAHTSIFEYIAQNIVHYPIFAQTWRNGAGGPIASSDNVLTVCKLEGKNSAFPAWKNSKDHSKYVVSTASGNPYVGVGDLNRMRSQWVRGGSFFMLSDRQLWDSFIARIQETDVTCSSTRHTCPHNKVRRHNRECYVCLNTPCTDTECCESPPALLGSTHAPLQPCRDNDTGLDFSDPTVYADWGSWRFWSCRDGLLYGYCKSGTKNRKAMATFCPRSCAYCKETCPTNGIVYEGQTLSDILVTNQWDCAEQCKQHIRCEFWSMAHEGERCKLMGSDGTLVSDPAWVSGSKLCDSPCLDDDPGFRFHKHYTIGCTWAVENNQCDDSIAKAYCPRSCNMC